MKANNLLILAGISSTIVSLLHISIMVGGSDWYRFFGAGEGMAQLAESGSPYPALITGVLVVIFAICAVYAFSGAGIIKRMPLVKSVLVIIAAGYILRGVFGIPIVIYADLPYANELEGKMMFMVLSSLVSLSFGLFYLIGVIQVSRAGLKKYIS